MFELYVNQAPYRDMDTADIAYAVSQMKALDPLVGNHG